MAIFVAGVGGGDSLGHHPCRISSSTSCSSGILLMPPWWRVERLAAQQAKRVMADMSSADNASGALSSFNIWLMALPPKISPAPVVSTTWMPVGQAVVPLPLRLAK